MNNANTETKVVYATRSTYVKEVATTQGVRIQG